MPYNDQVIGQHVSGVLAVGPGFDDAAHPCRLACATGRVSFSEGSSVDTSSQSAVCLTATGLRRNGPAILGGRGSYLTSISILIRRASRVAAWSARDAGPRGRPGVLSLLGTLSGRGIPRGTLGDELVVRSRPRPVPMNRPGPLGGALDVFTTEVPVRAAVSWRDAQLPNLRSLAHQKRDSTPFTGATVKPQDQGNHGRHPLRTGGTPKRGPVAPVIRPALGERATRRVGLRQERRHLGEADLALEACQPQDPVARPRDRATVSRVCRGQKGVLCARRLVTCGS